MPGATGREAEGNLVRAFIAVELPAEIRQTLAELSRRLRASRTRASWVSSENLHITLRFLGDVEDGLLNRLGEGLAESYGGQAAFRLRIEGAGAFPNPRRPRVLWAAISEPHDALRSVQAIAEDSARAIGLEPDTKTFSPHITLARIRTQKGIEGLRALVEQEAQFYGGEFLVEAVSLFSSRLTDAGAVYKRLREFRFSWT